MGRNQKWKTRSTSPRLTATAYTLLDRRRLQVRFPVLARLNWWQTILAAVVASLVAIVVWMAIYAADCGVGCPVRAVAHLRGSVSIRDDWYIASK